MSFNSYGNDKKEKYKQYTELEIETEKCLDKIFEEKGVNFQELKTVYENYFSSGKISKSTDPLEKQYEDILSYWEHPDRKLPIFKDKKRVVAIKEKLGLSDNDVLQKHTT